MDVPPSPDNLTVPVLTRTMLRRGGACVNGNMHLSAGFCYASLKYFLCSNELMSSEHNEKNTRRIDWLR